MLPSNYRIQVQNATNAAMAAGDTITVNVRRVQIVSGALVNETTKTNLTPAGMGNSLAINAYANSNSIDNSGSNTTQDLKAVFEIIVVLSNSPTSGQINVFLESSADNTDFGDDGSGEFLCAIPVTANGTFKRTIEV